MYSHSPSHAQRRHLQTPTHRSRQTHRTQSTRRSPNRQTTACTRHDSCPLRRRRRFEQRDHDQEASLSGVPSGTASKVSNGHQRERSTGGRSTRRVARVALDAEPRRRTHRRGTPPVRGTPEIVARIPDEILIAHDRRGVKVGNAPSKRSRFRSNSRVVACQPRSRRS